LRENEFQFLFLPPAFNFDLAHPCADGTRKRFTPDQHVELIPRGEAVRIKFVLVLVYAKGQVAGESRIQPARLVRHDVSPIGLHAFAPDCTRIESSGADSSGLTKALRKILTAMRFGSRNGTSLCGHCGSAWGFVSGRRCGDAKSRPPRHTILARNSILLDMPSRIPTASLGEPSGEGSAALVWRIVETRRLIGDELQDRRDLVRPSGWANQLAWRNY
jgi:hypothetical protein